MGTDLENVLQDLQALKEHLIYLAECRGNRTLSIEVDIDLHINQLKNLARIINGGN